MQGIRVVDMGRDFVHSRIIICRLSYRGNTCTVLLYHPTATRCLARQRDKMRELPFSFLQENHASDAHEAVIQGESMTVTPGHPGFHSAQTKMSLARYHYQSNKAGGQKPLHVDWDAVNMHVHSMQRYVLIRPWTPPILALPAIRRRDRLTHPDTPTRGRGATLH